MPSSAELYQLARAVENVVLFAGCSEAEVRLEGLGSREVGRVQVCEEGGWREVCVPATLSGRWRESNAAVVCRQLSYSSGALLATPDR